MSSQKELFNEIKADYDEAYKCLDKALKYDEEGKREEALPMYEFGLTLIEKALNTPLISPSTPDIEWEKTYAMIQKMRKTRKEIQIRMSELEAQQVVTELPPSYEEAVSAVARTPSEIPSTSQSNPPIVPFTPAVVHYNIHPSTSSSYSHLSDQLQQMQLDPINREILYSHNNVRLYFIAPDGIVSATSEPDVLIIGRIEGAWGDEGKSEDLLGDTLDEVVEQLKDEKGSKTRKGHRRHHHRHHRKNRRQNRFQQGSGQIYIQVGSWVYPLIPGVSPCYRSDFGAFILPDLNSDVPGAAIGIILPPDADQSVFEILNSILSGVLVNADESHSRHRRSDASVRRKSSHVSSNIIRGATYIANNLIKGAGNTARYIDMATPRIISKIKPNEEAQPVNPTLKKTLNVAKTVTGTAANVTDYLATKVGQGAVKLGEYLAPFVQKQGEKLLTTASRMSEDEAKEKVGTVLDVTSSTIKGIATVYGGLETAASLLGHSLANNSVQIIEHKYGQPVGEATNNAFETAGNVHSIRRGYKMMKPMGVLKATAAATTNHMLPNNSDNNETNGTTRRIGNTLSNETPHEGFEGSGPGSGSGFRPK